MENYITTKGKWIIFVSAGLLMLSSCMTYQKTYVKNPDLNRTDFQIELDEVAHTLYMIGDAGTTKFFEDSTLYNHVKKQLAEDQSTSTLVYLGDNIYPAGLPPKDDAKRGEKEAILDIQLSVSPFVDGATYFIPGNHDWKNATSGGFERIRFQENYVEHQFENLDIELLPDSGCGMPAVRDIDKDLRFIFLDTQWWLHRQKREAEMQEICETTDRQVFLNELQKILDDSKDKQVVIFLHHPLYTRGPHKGISSWKTHIFPLTEVNKKLWIPIPALGTLLSVVRKAGASRQDLPNPMYKKLKRNLLDLTKEHDNLVFASGHDHSLQYYNLHNKHFVVSGSGGKLTFARKKGKAEMVRADHGYSIIHFMKNGEIWLNYYLVNSDMPDGSLIFRRSLSSK